jgi:type I restriction enzyme S subunit
MLSISGYRGVEQKHYEDENRRRTAAELETYRVVRPGQLAVNTMWLNYGGLGVSELTGHVSPAYRAYWISSSFEKRYLHHLMRSDTYIDAYTSRLTGIRPNSLQMSRDNLMAFPIIRPPREEQVRIANFLDRETAEIDAFIADQKELVRLLAERRAAAISHAVTDVPGSFQVPVRRFTTSLGQGWSPVCEQEAAEPGQWGVLKVGCVNGATFRPAENKALPSELEPRTEFSAMRGDVLVSRGNTRELVGSAALVDTDYPTLLVSDLLYRIRVDMRRVSNEYFVLALASNFVRGQIESSAKGSSGSMQKISQGDLLSLRIWLPSIKVQDEIVAKVAQETAELDAAMTDAREAVALSRERRAALISAAVTGKIDVREHGAVA